MILVVTGSRTYKSRLNVFGVLDAIDDAKRERTGNGITYLISGNCPRGADNFAESWAKKAGVQLILVPAMWNSRHGLNSGKVRNGTLLNLANEFAGTQALEIRLAAFPSRCTSRSCLLKDIHWSHGTEDCWDKAGELNIPRRSFIDETLK